MMNDKDDLQSLDKIKLIELEVASVKVNDTQERIEVKYIVDPRSRIMTSNCFLPEPINIHFNTIEDYENFLKLFDFSTLLILNFNLTTNIEILKLFNKYNTNPNSFFSVSINDSGELDQKDSNDIFNLINNIKNSNEIYLTLNFPHQKTPENFTFSEMSSLKVISIKEVNGTQFLNREIISHLLNTCPDLRSFRISAINKGIYYEIMKLIFAKQTSSILSGCKNISFDAHFIMEHDFRPIIVNYYQDLFLDKNFDVSILCFPNDNGKLGYSFYGSKKCHSCGHEHVVNFFFEIES
ncbi:Hypothetical protein SRAE_1000040200 [Strongyloides ratti]|uniref:Uncharacterized protein n=1 Tax=Strongyloides ratti TaxID=34506 RepID=A0A090MUB5_STRRB|nr:Hypothetical protein SRAE_1000040200 [Strongyloides ratti]CEF62128.1 Hypothetical protein SRAE_1000040200 [Strongyloides ratti]